MGRVMRRILDNDDELDVLIGESIREVSTKVEPAVLFSANLI